MFYQNSMSPFCLQYSRIGTWRSRFRPALTIILLLHLILYNLHTSQNFLQISPRNMNNLSSSNIHYNIRTIALW